MDSISLKKSQKILNILRIALVWSLAFAFVGTTVVPVDAGWSKQKYSKYKKYKKKHKKKISKSFSADGAFTIPGNCFKTADEDLDDVIDAMSDFGYSVDSGHLELYDPETSNIYIPFADNHTDYLVAHFEETGDNLIRFGGTDLLLFQICSPGRNHHFSFGAYNAARILDQNANGVPTEFTVLEASLGDPVNPVSIVDNNVPPDPYNAFTNIALTGDEQSWTDIVTAFTNAGLLSEETLTKEEIPQELFQFSTSDSDLPRDTLSYIFRFQPQRMVHPEARPLDLNGYFSQGFPVYRFSKNEKDPRTPVMPELRDPAPPYKQVLIKKRFQRKFDYLVRKVVRDLEKKYDLEFISSTPFVPEGSPLGPPGDPSPDGIGAHIFDHGEFCIENQVDCQFDKRDSLYWWDQEAHTLGDEDFYILIGIDHTKLGMAELSTRSLFLVNNPDNGNAFEQIDTLRHFDLKDYPVSNVLYTRNPFLKFVAHKSFLVQVARPQNCIEGIAPFCIDTDILAADQEFIVTGELTLNPKTGTRPDEEHLVSWQLLKFKVSNP